jgi:hypothetical protein
LCGKGSPVSSETLGPVIPFPLQPLFGWRFLSVLGENRLGYCPPHPPCGDQRIARLWAVVLDEWLHPPPVLSVDAHRAPPPAPQGHRADKNSAEAADARHRP